MNFGSHCSKAEVVVVVEDNSISSRNDDNNKIGEGILWKIIFV